MLTEGLSARFHRPATESKRPGVSSCPSWAPTGARIEKLARNGRAQTRILLVKRFHAVAQLRASTGCSSSPTSPLPRQLWPWVDPQKYNRESHRRRNNFERLFRRSGGLRRIFSCFEHLKSIFVGIIIFPPMDAAIVEPSSVAIARDSLRSCPIDRMPSRSPRCSWLPSPSPLTSLTRMPRGYSSV